MEIIFVDYLSFCGLVFRCDPGNQCVPVVNELLQLPVAHCVQDTASEGQEGEGRGGTFSVY